jgi:hypothetical protein
MMAIELYGFSVLEFEINLAIPSLLQFNGAFEKCQEINLGGGCCGTWRLPAFVVRAADDGMCHSPYLHLSYTPFEITVNGLL